MTRVLRWRSVVSRSSARSAMCGALLAVSFLAAPAEPALAATTHTVTYDGNQGTGTMAAGTYTEGGDPYLVAENEFVRAGYDFAGWNTQMNAQGTGYRPGQTFRPAEDVTLFAQWRSATYVAVAVSGPNQVYRTVAPRTLRATTVVGIDQRGAGIVRFKHEGVVIGTVRLNVQGGAAMRVPTSLPVGRTSFTAEFVPRSPDLAVAESRPVGFTVARVSTITRVAVRQHLLSTADQRRFGVRSALVVAAQVIGNGSGTPPTGRVVFTVGTVVGSARLVDGRVTSGSIPSPSGRVRVFATYQPDSDSTVRSAGLATIMVR